MTNIRPTIGGRKCSNASQACCSSQRCASFSAPARHRDPSSPKQSRLPQPRPPETGASTCTGRPFSEWRCSPRSGSTARSSAQATPNGYFYVDRKPGTYEITTTTEVERKLSLTLDKDQMRYVRLGISMGFFVGHVYPELVDTDVGLKELQDCRYTGK